MLDIEDAIRAAFARIYPTLLTTPKELARRLARRRTPTLLRPPRAACWSLRADDTRLDAFTPHGRPNLAAFHDSHLARDRYVAKQRRTGQWPSTETVTLTAAALRKLTAPVIFDHALSAPRAADLLGVNESTVRLRSKEVPNDQRAPTLASDARRGDCPDNPPVLFQLVDTRGDIGIFPNDARGVAHAQAMGWPSLDCEQAKVYSRGRRRVAFRPLEPGAWLDPTTAHVGKGITPDFLPLWDSLRESVPPDLNQSLRRHRFELTRRVRSGEVKTCLKGWKWSCPRCGQPTKMLYLPIPFDTLLDKWEIEVPQPKGEQQDRLAPRPEFACRRCLHVEMTRPDLRNQGWNLLVSYLTGGLLYGREVPRPDWLEAQAQRPRRANQARFDQITQLRNEGKTWRQIAQVLNIANACSWYHQNRPRTSHPPATLPPNTPTQSPTQPHANTAG